MKSGLFLSLLVVASVMVGCSKSSSDSSTPKVVDLGTVEMAYNTPVKKDLGNKLICTFTAQPLDANGFELGALLEGRGKPEATRVIPAPINQPVLVTFPGLQIKLVVQFK